MFLATTAPPDGAAPPQPRRARGAYRASNAASIFPPEDHIEGVYCPILDLI